MLAVTLDAIDWPQVLLAGMLICFGISWPVDIAKALRAKQVGGKSIGFMVLIFIGYLSGLSGQIVKANITGKAVEYTTWLFAINAMLVAFDIGLYMKYRRQNAPSA